MNKLFVFCLLNIKNYEILFYTRYLLHFLRQTWQTYINVYIHTYDIHTLHTHFIRLLNNNLLVTQN